MIEFRWVHVDKLENVGKYHIVAAEQSEPFGPLDMRPVVLQWRVGVHKISTKEDAWEDWQTVPFDDSVTL